MKTTNIGKTYWSETGAYQKEYSELCRKLVPEVGPAKTLKGELLRVAGNLIYEYSNNGNCNAFETTVSNDDVRCSYCTHIDDEFETCEHCDGSGIETEDNYEYSVNISFYKYLNLISTTLSNPEVDEAIEKIVSLILSRPHIGIRKNDVYFSDENQAFYSVILDHIVFYCLNNEDKELPVFYKIEEHE